ncbi:hypothetical protein BURPS668_A1040 [Burkholderia pseudomallei 668]|nr:hypothetical protein BURPS668_A1040 [Burkholderia pseudomallei 668]
MRAVAVGHAWRRAAAAAVKVLRRVVVRWRVRRDDGVGQGRCRVIEVRAGGAGGGRRPCAAEPTFQRGFVARWPVRDAGVRSFWPRGCAASSTAVAARAPALANAPAAGRQ